MFFDKEIIYTDVLEEWRKVKIWDFNLFDKVLVKWIERPWIIIGDKIDSIYKSSFDSWYVDKIKNWDPKEIRWWKIENKWESYETIKYNEYLLIDSTWNTISSYEVKKYYWEFQKEFESLDKAVKDEEILKKKIEEIKSLEKSINENYQAARSIQGKNYKELWII